MTPKRLLLIVANIVLLSLAFALILQGEKQQLASPAISPYLSLGFLMVSAYLMGLAVKEYGLPALTGYLAAGILYGPACMNYLSSADIHSLEMINAIALSFIAITAGGELRMASLKKNARAIGLITLSHTVVILVGCLAILAGYFLLLPPANGTMRQWMMMAILLAVVAVAKSPASTIAIINECRSRGPFTDIVLGVTMVKDVVVLILFAVAMAIVRGIDSSTMVSIAFMGHLIAEILISIGAGVVFGVLMILFYRYVAREVSVFIVLASLAAHELALSVGLEHMLMCMVAGFVVQNYSARGPLMIEGIERSQLPIYVVFFSIAGAGLDFSLFGGVWLTVLVFVVVRTALVYGSTWLGTLGTGCPDAVGRYAWTGFLTNAGLTLSIVIVVEQAFPDWGRSFKAIVISVIAINQILGPILFKIGLTRSGESRA